MRTQSDIRSAYVHIPFCAQVCPYCDFAVVAGREETTTRYMEALHREIDDEPPWSRLDAVYFGGGTPSRVPRVTEVLAHLEARFGFDDDAELSLEANPEDWTPALGRVLREAGFNRVSFGAQSFDESVLGSLGRAHSSNQIVDAVTTAREAGFRSVSLDLIYGTPGESIESWERSLRMAIAAGVDHISTYALTVEPPTELGRAVRRGAPAPDPDDQADKWEAAVRLLGSAGFSRYEVSNHARHGRVCTYNMGVWHQGEYIAFGLGAHGFRNGVRSRNVRRLDTYVDRVERGIGPVQSAERVEGWAAEQERLMLGLRLAGGVVSGPGGAALMASADGRRLIEAGVIRTTADVPTRVEVVRPLLTDEAVRAVLGLEQPGQ